MSDGSMVNGQSSNWRFGAYEVRRYLRAREAIHGGDTTATPRLAGALPHRFDWFEAMTDGYGWWLEVSDLQHRPVAGFAVTITPTRALPGHRLLRLERMRFVPDPGPAEAAVRYLADVSRGDPRIIGLSAEIFFADEAEKNHAIAALLRAGLRAAGTARMYTHTARIDLRPELEAILAGFRAGARRNIRAVAKYPVETRLVHDATLAPRLRELELQAFGRTAGAATQLPWPELIEFCNAHPGLARLVSLVRTDCDGPEALVAFALGLNHGDHVEYSAAGSTRPPDLKMPLGYALAWDLMEWARSVGAQWFDFGGIAPDPATDGVRHRIHDFKRAFEGDVVEVSQSWSFEARPIRGAWVRGVSRLAEQLRRLGRSKSALKSAAAREPG